MDISEDELIELIRKIVKQEIKNNSSNIEYSYYGKVYSTNTDGTFNVQNTSDGGIYTNLLNQTGASLSVGDVVKISAKGDKTDNKLYICLASYVQKCA